MAGWKKIITSGSHAELASVTASLNGTGTDITGVKTENLTGTITNAQLAGSIANGKLANSTISGVALGSNLSDLTVDNSTLELDSGTTYNGSTGLTISAKDGGITLAKQANMAADRIQGRANGAGAGAPQALTAAQVRTIISVEEDADVTDTTNVTNAGALMDSELAEIATIKTLTAAKISGSLGDNATLIRTLTAATISGSIDAVSASFSTRVTANDAKVTANTSNVTSAGALMDSELAEIATVKTLTAAKISGSLGDNATLIRTLSASTISGSFTALSSSLASRVTTAEATDGDITGVDLTGQTGGITIANETNTTSGNYSADIQLPTALTVPESIKNDSLVIGRSTANDLITFTNGDIALGIGGTERLGIDANGIQVTGDAVISGDLTVNGDLTTIATTNTLVEDQLMFLGTGSAGSNLDVGILAQSGSFVDSGSALYHDINSERWSVAKGISSIAVAITPLQHVVTVTDSTATPGPADGEYGVGEMWVDTDASEPTGNGVIYIRTS